MIELHPRSPLTTDSVTKYRGEAGGDRGGGEAGGGGEEQNWQVHDGVLGAHGCEWDCHGLLVSLPPDLDLKKSCFVV